MSADMPFVPDVDRRYDKPVAFGPSVAPPVSRGYETYSATTMFLTSRAEVTPLLPRWFEAAEEPILTITHTRMRMSRSVLKFGGDPELAQAV